jgi:hypothetical protein
MHTTTTAAPNACPFCHTPTDSLLCWKCTAHGDDSRHVSVYDLPATPRRRLEAPATPTTPPRTIAELSTRPHHAPALHTHTARPGTHAAAERLNAARAAGNPTTLAAARNPNARHTTSKKAPTRPATIAELPEHAHYLPALQALMTRPATRAAATRLIAAQTRHTKATLSTIQNAQVTALRTGVAFDLTSNLVLLCHHHHTIVHQGFWDVRMDEFEVPWFIPSARIDPDRKPRPANGRTPRTPRTPTPTAA